MAEQRLFKAARIAEMLGCSRQYLNRYVKEKCPDARTGIKIDINHSSMLALFKSKGVDSSKPLKMASERTSAQAKKPVSQRETKSNKSRSAKVEFTDVPAQNSIPVSEYTNMTLSQIAMIHGTDEEFRGWLDARKKQEEVIERELKNKSRTGEVIDRDFVSSSLVSLIEELTSRILVDSPRKIVEIIYAHCESGDDKEDAEKSFRDELSKPIKVAKRQIIKRLKP